MGAKAEAGFVKQGPRCSTCKHMSYVLVKGRNYGWAYEKVKARRCGVHGFAVTANGYCPKYQEGKPVVRPVEQKK